MSSYLSKDEVGKFIKILSIFPSNYLPIPQPMSRQKLFLSLDKPEKSSQKWMKLFRAFPSNSQTEQPRMKNSFIYIGFAD
ncbi:MAG: hypothetical protein F6K17_13420 [Okeania sp. SIO3C4]|nr:hypothetical protein [Okeania sp. SIO3B3]NER03539.1 hypothetical protein [Okeania sp. SIO3C4]